MLESGDWMNINYKMCCEYTKHVRYLWYMSLHVSHELRLVESIANIRKMKKNIVHHDIYIMNATSAF